MKYIPIILLTLLLGLALFGCKKQEPETLTPKIKNDKVETSATTATFTWTVDWPGKLISVVEVSENEDMSHSQFYGSETETDNHNFSVTASDLKVSTKYYYRHVVWNHFYADNKFVMEEKNFTTKTDVPKVKTVEVTDVTRTTATVIGEVTDDCGAEVTERGVCWSTSHNPTIEDHHSNNGWEIGSYSVNIVGLITNVTYYVKTYAKNDIGVSYGDELSFTTDALPAPTGAINGLFSVKYNQQVWFSQGNLQYQASTNTWRFAENQWNYVGCQNATNGESGGNVVGSDNIYISETYEGWIDLFGWGTSGWNNGSQFYQPWSSSGCLTCYFNSGSLSGQYANADWGVYNAISNGGNAVGQWRTLTISEWEYVFLSRSTISGIRFAKACVNNVNGIILLPDNWAANCYTLNDTNNGDANYSSNVITSSQWYVLEQHGAVFLPAAGDRYATAFGFFGSIGLYWSTSLKDSSYAYHVEFGNNGLWPNSIEDFSFGNSVRLVRVVQ